MGGDHTLTRMAELCVLLALLLTPKLHVGIPNGLGKVPGSLYSSSHCYHME